MQHGFVPAAPGRLDFARPARKTIVGREGPVGNSAAAVDVLGLGGEASTVAATGSRCSKAISDPMSASGSSSRWP
jgi:hypothetical protein